jgi:hypothetical protein
VIEVFSTDHRLEKMLYLILGEEAEKPSKRRMLNTIDPRLQKRKPHVIAAAWKQAKLF